MFKLFRKKEKTKESFCPKCKIDHSVYPNTITDQQEWEQTIVPGVETILLIEGFTGRRVLNIGKLFSVHQPYPEQFDERGNSEALIKDVYKHWVIKEAQRHFQEIQNNHLPFPIR